MNSNTIKAYMFVAVMLALGGSVLWHWQSGRKKLFEGQDSQSPMMGQVRAASAREVENAKLTVGGQLAAFKANDYVKATSYQASGIKSRIGDPKRFRMMIENMYPEFSHYKAVQYGNISSSGDGNVLFVPIRLIGQSVTVTAEYFLRRENGMYRVAGVDGGMHSPPMRRQYPGHRPLHAPPVEHIVQQQSPPIGLPTH